MTWVRIDDGAPLHPKLLEVGPEAAWLWVSGLAHCNRSLTDGVIRKVFLPALYPSGHLSPRRLAELAGRLVTARLWHDEGDHYRVHEYEIQQELAMKEEVEARRRYERERKATKRREKLDRAVRDNDGTASGTTTGHGSHARNVSPTPGPARPGPANSDLSLRSRSGARAGEGLGMSPLARGQGAPLEHLEHLHAESKRVIGRAWFGLRDVREGWLGGGPRVLAADVERARAVLAWASDPDRTGGLEPRAAITRAVEGFGRTDDAVVVRSKRSLALFATDPGRWLAAGRASSAEPSDFTKAPEAAPNLPDWVAKEISDGR